MPGQENVESLDSVIRQYVQKLEQSMLYAMSLGSHELFHSNIWDYLINRDSRYAAIFFPKLGESRVESVREEKNRDLTIRRREDSRHLYVVECKVKSLPSHDQLRRYSQRIQNDGEILSNGVVTGFVKPDWTEDGWRFLSLGDIASGILSMAAREKDKKVRDLVVSYASTLKTEARLVSVLLDTIGDGFPDLQADWRDLERIRLKDLVFKLCASRFVSRLEHSPEWYRLQEKIAPKRLKATQSFGNGSWIVDVTIHPSENGDGNTPPGIGIQIQGRQFRRFAAYCYRGENDDIPKTFAWFRNNGWFSENLGSGWMGGHRSSQRNNPFCRYSNTAFVYQYIDIEDSSFETLSQMVFDHVRQALAIPFPHRT